MAGNKKKLDLEKYATYFTLALILSVVFLLYVLVFDFINAKGTQINLHKLNFLFFVKEYESLILLLDSLSIFIALSYVISAVIFGIGWYKEREKRIAAEKKAVGLEGALKKANQEKDFYKKKVDILEGGINSSAPPADKKQGKQGKKPSKVRNIIILVLFVLLGALLFYGLYWKKDMASTDDNPTMTTPNNNSSPKTSNKTSPKMGKEVQNKPNPLPSLTN